MSLLSVYCGLIFYLSHQPLLPVPNLFLHQDKLFHAFAYGVLALLAISYFQHHCQTRQPVYWFSFLFCALYGASDEWHQSFTIGREADAYDFLADTLGPDCLY